MNISFISLKVFLEVPLGNLALWQKNVGFSLHRQPFYDFLTWLNPNPPIYNKSGIDSWHRDLCNYAVSAEYAHTIDHSLELGRMKERNTSAVHEYLLAKLQHADGRTLYLRIERFPEDYIPTTTRQRYTSHVSSSMASLKDRGASDEVSTVNGWPRHNRVLERVDVTNANITLLDPTIAAWVVRVNNDQHRLLSWRCYSYSDMVLRVLEDAYRFRVDRYLSRDVEQAWLAEEYSKGPWAVIPLHE
ncbi:hypothetical protein BU17DRAFT_66240 [Hysterangium stoloniferum]|nr:hypothetical protein BU17DRAFT_66240 [Hysterangium stoloniferum]